MVESLSYQNPIIIVFGVGAAVVAGFKHGTFVEVAKLIRDWSGIRRQREADIAKTQAETREINARASRVELEAELRRKLSPLSTRAPSVADIEPSSDQLAAINRLADSSVTVEVVEDDDE